MQVGLPASPRMAGALSPDRRPGLSPGKGTWPQSEGAPRLLHRGAVAAQHESGRRRSHAKACRGERGPTAAATKADNVVLPSAAGDCHLPERRQALSVWYHRRADAKGLLILLSAPSPGAGLEGGHAERRRCDVRTSACLNGYTWPNDTTATRPSHGRDLRRVDPTVF